MEAGFVICGLAASDEWNVSRAVARLSLSKGEGEGEGSSKASWRRRLSSSLNPFPLAGGERREESEIGRSL